MLRGPGGGVLGAPEGSLDDQFVPLCLMARVEPGPDPRRYWVCVLAFVREVVGVVGFEPTVSCSQSTCDNQASLHPDARRSVAYPARLNVTPGRLQQDCTVPEAPLPIP